MSIGSKTSIVTNNMDDQIKKLGEGRVAIYSVSHSAQSPLDFTRAESLEKEAISFLMSSTFFFLY